MPLRNRPRRAWTLVELLVVLGIISLLIALLMPVMSAVRRASRATTCLVKLQQWGAAYTMYTNANRGRSLSSGPYPARLDRGTPPIWWELLQPYHTEITQSLLCPEATDPANYAPSGPFQAWGPQHLWDSPGHIRGTYVGSYGINDALLEWVAAPGDPAAPSVIPRADASNIPLIFDCADWHTYPLNDDPPTLYRRGAPLHGITMAALERHRAGTQVVFVDAHADYVPTAGLWKLRWSADYVPKDVTVRR
jgi:prepilin-type N-terminal cleavage/methylation domain-containing protein